MRMLGLPIRFAGVVALGCMLALSAGPEARAGFVPSGADYLLTIQDSGGYFHDASPTSFYASTQGMIGLGMLTAYQQSCQTGCNASYLNSAVKLGDAMLDPQAHALIPSSTSDAELYFDPGLNPTDRQNPIVWTQNTLFLQRFSAATGNAAYSGFLQTQLWNKLTTGTYGAGVTSNAYAPTGVGANGFVAVVQARCDEYSPWCLAKPAVAANLSHENGITSTLMLGIKTGLENFSGPGDGTFGFEVLGLAAAIWASALTGIDLDPTTGWWASANSTHDLAGMLAALIDGSGGFPPGIYPGAPATDLETTGNAVLALALIDPIAFHSEILDGLAFLKAQQEVGGCVDSDTTCLAGISGEVLQYYADIVADDSGDTPVLRSPEEIIRLFYAPEPMSIALMGAGMIGFVVVRRRGRAA